MKRATKAPKPDQGNAAQAYYEKVPPSSVGEFAHAQAKLADLSDQPNPSGLTASKS